MHISSQKEAIWNTLSVFLSDGGPPNVAGPGKTFPLSSPLDGPGCIIGYGITLKLSQSKYKIRYNFMGSSLVFQFLDINVLNYCYFHTDCLTFFKIKNVGKIKNVKKRVF